MKSVAAVIAGLLIVCAVGCSSKDTVYESDRGLQDQNAKASQIALDDMAKVHQALDASSAALASVATPEAATAAAAVEGAKLAVAEATQADLDILNNSKQELKNWGAPKAPKDYTPTNSDALRKKSDQDHTTPWYKHWLMYLAYGASAALTVAGLAAQFFPGLGTFLGGPAARIGKSLLGAIVNIGHKADAAPDDKIHLDDVKAEVQTVLADNPSAAAWVNKVAGKLHVDKLLHGVLGTSGPDVPATSGGIPAAAPVVADAPPAPAADPAASTPKATS